MSALGVLALASLAGLNPWLVALIVAGLATFTRHAPVVEPLASVLGIPLLLVLGAVLGVEVVASKVEPVANAVELINLPAAAAVGAIICLSLMGAADSGYWPAVAGAALATGVRLGRRRLTLPLNRYVRPYGHIAAGIASDVLAGSMTAVLFIVKP